MVVVTSHFQTHQKRSPASYRDQIQSLVGLPTLPIIATEILKITREDRISINQMVPIIDKDPALGMKLLKVANSAYYGIEEKVDSLRQAIVIIGLNELATLATGFSIIKAFDQRNDSGLEWKSFWEHCAATAHIAEILSGKMRILLPSSPYSLGLLHDIGKLVLYRINPGLFIESLKIAKDKNCQANRAELEAFGISHSEAGKWISEKWQLPNVIIQAIGYHHTPAEIPDFNNKGSVALTQLADFVSNLKGIYFGTQFIPEEIEGWRELQVEYDHLYDLDPKELILSLGDHLDFIRNMVQIY